VLQSRLLHFCRLPQHDFISMSGEAARPEKPQEIFNPEFRWTLWDWAAAGALFLGTAAVVVWQNLHVGVLWDLSYILETAQRISRGDIPYKTFVLPYAPGTFLVQAAIIKFTGRVFWHHIVYAATVGGLGSVLAWRIVFGCLCGRVPSARLIAFLLSVPLIVLGIYCIFPHPFYDPDCAFAILAALLLLQNAERRGFPRVRSLLAGFVAATPVFIKQNEGLAFLVSVVAAIGLLFVIETLRGRPGAGYAWVLAGIGTGLSAALALIHATAGLANYWHWTFQFAAARRMPNLGEMLAQYGIHSLILWIPAFAIGAVLLVWHARQRSSGRAAGQITTVAAVVLMSLPFIWAVAYMFLDDDASERAERLLVVWPFVLIVALAIALIGVRRRASISMVLPFIVIATAQGAFLSQQLWGSTYALWPFLAILLAGLIATLGEASEHVPGRPLVAYSAVLAVTMLAAGPGYAFSHERLSYADVDEGSIARSNLRPLAGLSVRGPWIPQFAQLAEYAQQSIPEGDGIVMLPGEDLFYFTTDRRPRLPVLMFDHTVNPYPPEEVAVLARDNGIRWLIVKRKLQIQDDAIENEKAQLLSALRSDFTLVAALDNYDVYYQVRSGAGQ
jgi:hypothetical protein